MRLTIITLLLASAIVSIAHPIYVVAISSDARAFMAMNVVSAIPLVALCIVVIMRLISTSSKRVLFARFTAVIGILLTLFVLFEGVSSVLQSWAYANEMGDIRLVGIGGMLVRNVSPNLVITAVILTAFLPWKEDTNLHAKRAIL